MARRGSNNNAAIGCLALIALPFMMVSWCVDTCTGRIEKERAERLAREQAAEAEARRADEAERRQKEGAESLAKKRQADLTAATIAAIRSWKPYERATLAVKCAKDAAACPDGKGDPAGIYDAAKNDAERKQLRAAFAQGKAQLAAEERRQARLNAALRCCDGTDSPSCTCGYPHRGCCSHHGGVCGCSAD